MAVSVDDDVALAPSYADASDGPAAHVGGRIKDEGGRDNASHIVVVPPLPSPPPPAAGAGRVVVDDDDWQYIRVWERFSSSGEIIRTEARSRWMMDMVRSILAGFEPEEK
jgi:hypothetical protein